MLPELRKAHQANDRAVMKAYGFAPTVSVPEIVTELMKCYQVLAQSDGKCRVLSISILPLATLWKTLIFDMKILQ